MHWFVAVAHVALLRSTVVGITRIRTRRFWQRGLGVAVLAGLLAVLSACGSTPSAPPGSPTASAGGPYTADAGIPVLFSGAGSSDPSGSAITLNWNFGDNTIGTGVLITHTYNTPGTYAVSLAVTNTQGASSSASATATITGLPTASTGGPYVGFLNQPVAFNGAGSSAADGTPLTYLWNFGDGATGSGIAPSHTYSTSGTFTVSLTVTDARGGSKTATSSVDVEFKPNANAGGPYQGSTGQSVQFDGSGSTPTGVTLNYSWDFGDGVTGTGVKPTHTYAGAGTFQVTLNVSSSSGDASSAATTCAVTAGPMASAGGPYVGKKNQSITFDGTHSSAATGLTLTYSWDYGDGKTGTGATPSHTYASAGTFSVRLTVTDDHSGLNIATVTAAIASIPNVTITSPASMATVNTGVVAVTGTVDDAPDTVAVNGVAATVSGNSFTAANVPLSQGTNILTASAADTSGNVGTASVSVTLDNTAPLVTVDFPVENSVSIVATNDVTGMVNDLVSGANSGSATVTVNGTPAVVSNRRYILSGFALTQGLNTITVVGTDAAGNAATVLRHVTYSPAVGLPQVTLVSGNSQTALIGAQLAAPLVVSLTDAVGQPVNNQMVIFKVGANNGTLTGGGMTGRSVAVQTDAQGHAQATWVVGSRYGVGNNVVNATAVGFAGAVCFMATATPSGPALISLDSGNNQSGVVGSPLPQPFIAVATDSGHNRLVDVPITFTVMQGMGNFGGLQSFTLNTDADGKAMAFLTLGSTTGIENNVVQANFAGNAGFPAVFVASGMGFGNVADTKITGVVLDNSNVPIPGARISIDGSIVATLSDAQGQFVIPNAPVGTVRITVDGSTTTRSGVWPSLPFSIVTVSGQNNTFGMPVYLLPLDVAHGLQVDATHGGLLTIPNMPGFSLNIAPGSATFPDGTKSGVVSVTLVHADKIPHTPNFGQQPRFIVSIQPAGTKFFPPAALQMPNVDGLKPGEVTEMYSFDHDQGKFVSIGTGTVSDDGSVLKSDPGVGVVTASWHCGGDPATTGGSGSLSVSIAPTAKTLAVNQTATFTASGSPPLDGTYTWEILATQTGDDAGAATLVTQPSCDDASTCSADVKGAKDGTATLRVHFICTKTGDEVTADARITVVMVNSIKAAIPATAPLAGSMLTSTAQIPSGALTFSDATFAGPGALVLLQNGVGTTTLTVTVTPAGSDVAFEVRQDPADAASGPVPTVAKTGSNTATMAADGYGSFQVLAYVDSNGNGTRDDDESGALLPVVFVKAALSSNISAAHSGNITYTSDGTDARVSSGMFDLTNSGATAAVYLGGKVDLIGGGADGRRGLDRVFGGWIQDIPVALGVTGTYAGGHTESYIFATNFPAGKVFLPGDPAPVLAVPPLLDTGRSPASVGGISAALSHSHVSSRTDLATGQEFLIEAVDSPGLGAPLDHPGFPGNALMSYQFNLDFRAYLSLWTNATAVEDPTGDAADTSYSEILEQPWTIRSTYTVDATGNGTAVGTPTVAAGAGVKHSPIVLAGSTALNIATPTGLQLLGQDASH